MIQLASDQADSAYADYFLSQLRLISQVWSVFINYTEHGRVDDSASCIDRLG